jgi:HD domain.
MRKVLIDHVQPGMKLARSIFTSDGNVLLGSGVELSQRYIKRLKGKGIFHIYIEDELSQGIEIDDVITDETRTQAKAIVKKVMFDIIEKDTISEASQITSVVNRIVDELLESKDVLVNLNDMRLMDEYTFGHCVNVCVLSVMTGIAMGYNQLRLRDLGVGALLHDIGKMKISADILKKPGRLTEDEYKEIKMHTILGFDILRQCDDISKVSANTALGHHERCDGTGYPNKLHKNQIHEFSKN